jgi:hypothetical protein
MYISDVLLRCTSQMYLSDGGTKIHATFESPTNSLLQTMYSFAVADT